MFLSLLKNMAECFMKAIRGLSFSSANEHQPYVNKRNFSLQQQQQQQQFLEVSFKTIFCSWHAAAMFAGVCLDRNRCDVASAALG